MVAKFWYWVIPVAVVVAAAAAVVLYLMIRSNPQELLAGTGFTPVEDPDALSTSKSASVAAGAGKTTHTVATVSKSTTLHSVDEMTAHFGRCVRLITQVASKRLYVGIPGRDGNVGALHMFDAALGDPFDTTPTTTHDATTNVTNFGTCVDVTDDESLVFVSSMDGPDVGIDVFTRDGMVLLYTIPGTALEYLGRKLRVSADGSVVAATRDTGVVEVYTRDGDTWGLTATLGLPDGPAETLDMDRRARFIAISCSTAGTVHVFRSDKTGAWTRTQTLTPLEGSPATVFGTAVAFSNTSYEQDTYSLAIGASTTDLSPGEVSVYEYRGAWQLVTSVRGDADTSAHGVDTFGSNLAWEPYGVGLLVAVGSASTTVIQAVYEFQYSYADATLTRKNVLYPTDGADAKIYASAETTKFAVEFGTIAAGPNAKPVCVGAWMRTESSAEDGAVYTFQ